MKVKCTLDAHQCEIRIEVTGAALQGSNAPRTHIPGLGYRKLLDGDSEFLKSFLVGILGPDLAHAVRHVVTDREHILVGVHNTYSVATLSTLLSELNAACWMNNSVCETELVIRYA